MLYPRYFFAVRCASVNFALRDVCVAPKSSVILGRRLQKFYRPLCRGRQLSFLTKI